MSNNDYGIDTSKSYHRPPTYHGYKQGAYATVTICKSCKMVGLYEDCHDVDPCSACGSGVTKYLRDFVDMKYDDKRFDIKFAGKWAYGKWWLKGETPIKIDDIVDSNDSSINLGLVGGFLLFALGYTVCWMIN